VLIISGRIDHVELVLAEFNRLYNDENNHTLKLPLYRTPSKKEEKMIIDYALKTFQTQVWIISLADGTSEINIRGKQRQ
jgi:hypothetical protein